MHATGSDALCPEQETVSKHQSPWRHLLHQYWWLLIIIAPASTLLVIPTTVHSGPITSSKLTTPWNDSEDPAVIAQLTDVHVNNLEPIKGQNLHQAINACAQWNIRDILITGDLVDNWGYRSFGKYGQQHEPDFQAYHNILEGICPDSNCNKRLTETAGNHDLFGLFRYSSSRNNYRKYARSAPQDVSRFWASPVETNDFILLPLNPFRFPTPHAKFDFWVMQTTEILDRLEKGLKEATEMSHKHPGRPKPIILLCHYPAKLWILDFVRSSTGKTFKEILQNSEIALYLSGHIHPDKSKYVHYQGILEVCAQDLAQHNAYSIITIDNGRAYHRTYDIHEVPKVLLTHPIPSTMLTKLMPFSEKTTSIRLLSMNKSLNIQVSGAVNGKMKCVRQLKNGAWLYTHPLTNLENGLHTLEFSGDWEYKVEFFVGKTIESFTEDDYSSFNCFIVSGFVGVFIIGVNLMYLMPCQLFSRLEVNERIQLLPERLRHLLIFAMFAPVILPFSFVDIEGYIGWTFWYGYYADFSLVYDLWGQVICLVYEAGVVLSAVLFASTMAKPVPWRWVFVLDVVFSIGLLWGCVCYALSAIIEASGQVFACTSPLFVFMPVILYLSILGWRVRECFKQRIDDAGMKESMIHRESLEV